MKKSVLALAVLGAFAGAASAQSSVTMFGVVDLNVMTVDNGDRTYSMGTDGMASSRLGFRGVEDLGGGLKASFWLEMGIAPDTGRNAGIWGNGNRRPRNRQPAVLQPPFDRQPDESMGRTAPGSRLHRHVLELDGVRSVRHQRRRCGHQPGPRLGPADGSGWHHLRYAGPRQQHGGLHPAGRPVRSWSVWSSASCCGRRRSGQQVLRWPHRLRRGSVRRRGFLRQD